MAIVKAVDQSKPGGLRDLEREGLEQLQVLLREMRIVAQSVRAPLVTYFIDMAYLETSAILRGSRDIRPDKPS